MYERLQQKRLVKDELLNNFYGIEYSNFQTVGWGLGKVEGFLSVSVYILTKIVG